MIAVAVFVGWLAGIFTNYLADVLPWKRKFSHPFCVHCQQEVPWINYLISPRRCSNCGRRRGWRVWLVEVMAIMVSMWIWASPPSKLGYWLGMVVMIFFGVVTIIDLEYRLILHPVSIFGALLGLVVGVFLHGIKATLLGGAAGFGIMLLMYGLGIFFMKVSSRLRGQPVEEDALGYGDVNLSGVLGLMLGWPGIVAGLVIAILLGGAISLIYLILTILTRRYRAFTAIPYGPFLIAAAVLLLFFRALFPGNL